MTSEYVLWVINGLLCVVLWFMKEQHTRTKEDIKELERKYEVLKDTAVHKVDLREFKEDLYRRLDKLEEAIKQRGI